MATRAFTNVTTAVVSDGKVPIAFGDPALIIVFYRIQAGTVGDTVTIPASDTGYSDNIRAVMGTAPAESGLTTSANTQVVLTYDASGASTSVNYEVQLICRRS